MPPKVKFTRNEIIDAAFEIARVDGFSAVTARSISSRLSCSVAPIYVNFSTIEELLGEVVQQVFALSQKLLEKQEGENLFEKIGKASLAFAREYPVFFRELVMTPNPYLKDHDSIKDELVEALGDDALMGRLSFKQRRKVLFKMQVFQTGLASMTAVGHIPSWIDSNDLEDLLMETGRELLHAALIKKHRGVDV